jgi:hypothetical protein
VFGMELLASLDLSATNSFFSTFFALPTFFWRGFLASKLTPTDLVGFALVTFLLAGRQGSEAVMFLLDSTVAVSLITSPY